MIGDLEKLEKLGALREALCAEIGKRIVGQHAVIDELLITLFAGGHVLLEGVPGLAKTLLISTVAQAMDLEFRRIQFTPDLMPSDITGSEILEEDQSTGQRVFRFVKGPVFANIVLADEINRTPPKTQSALLQAMQERQVTAAGQTHDLGRPFFVLATQNPIEQEGTYPLPEAQLDRFMLRLRMGYPEPMDEMLILDEQKRAHPVDSLEPVADGPAVLEMQRAVREVYVDPAISDYIVRLVSATRTHPDAYLGASPRGSLALYRASQAFAALTGRDYVIPDDVKALAEPALAHRVILKTAASIRGVESRNVVSEMLMSVPIQPARPSGEPQGLRQA